MTRMPNRMSSWVYTATFAVLAMSACSSGSSLNLNARTTNAASDAGDTGDAGETADAGASDAGGIDLCGQLLVDRVRVVVRRIDLEQASSGADAGTGGGVDAGADAGMDAGTDHGDAGEISCDCPDGGAVCVKPGGHVHIGPFLVDVAGGDLAGGIHQVFDVEVPAGTYEDVKFVINTLSRHQDTGDGGLDGGLAEMQGLHASIAVDGLFGGARFLFKTPMHLQQRQEGPFVVGPGTTSIVLTLDPRSWFIGDQGRVLDPTDPRDRGRILRNIRCSVRMSSQGKDPEGRSFMREFEDDDRGDKCREDDDGEGEHGDLVAPGGLLDDHRGGGDDGDHGHHHPAKCPATPDLVCGDGGTPPPDGGTDAGVDAGMDGG